MNEDEVHSSLLLRAQRLSRLLTIGVVGIAVGLTCAVLYFVLSDIGVGGIGYGKFVGLTAGISASATFLTSLAAGFSLGRRYLVAQLRRWVGEAARSHQLQSGSLEYIVAMYENPPSSRPGQR